jgi:hypothetical protein
MYLLKIATAIPAAMGSSIGVIYTSAGEKLLIAP